MVSPAGFRAAANASLCHLFEQFFMYGTCFSLHRSIRPEHLDRILVRGRDPGRVQAFLARLIPGDARGAQPPLAWCS